MTDSPRRKKFTVGLSARLLLLTIFFVMVSEVLIYAPSIARYRKSWLDERIATAHLASLALFATPDRMVSDELEKDLLFHADAHAIVLIQGGMRMLALIGEMPPKADITVDLREGSFLGWVRAAFSTLGQDGNRAMRVVGVSPKDPKVVVEVLLDEAPMREAMVAFSARILQLSIVISLITAVAVYLSLQWLTVRPMRRITEAMVAFREDPENDDRIIQVGDRSDEVGVAEKELAAMQADIQASLRQKTRLATLGAAVAKVNHDLRNSLATAVLVSDRLADIDDPEVRRVTPRLYDAIDHAVNLCSQTLNYVGDQQARVERTRFALAGLVAEVGGDTITVVNEVAPDLEVDADREQLFRVLLNLARNAEQAGAETIRITAERGDGKAVLLIADDGPGMPQKAQDKLFQPFAGSTRKNGTGLGLVISRDLMRAHCGDMALEKTGEDGTTFRLELPMRCEV